MGDRVFCRLELFGITHLTAWDAVKKAIDTYLGAPDDSDAPNDLAFTEVNYGKVPEELDLFLQAAGFSYIWAFDSGGDFPPGVDAYSHETKESFSSMWDSNGDLLMTLEDASDPEKLALYQKWQKWFDAPKIFGCVDAASDAMLEFS